MQKACWDWREGEAGGTTIFRLANGVFVYQLCVGPAFFFLQPYGIGQLETTVLSRKKQPKFRKFLRFYHNISD